MSTPLKPWENETTRSRTLNSSAPMSSFPSGMIRSRIGGPPSLPPRPRILTNNGTQSYGSSGLYGRQMGYNSYSSPYSSFPSSIGGYGGGYGCGGYSGMYGGGMYGNSGYGYGMGPESRFIQLAEESTRPAFQGIESLVRAFGSISMMMDSTYFAVTNSFRAVLGVAENFGRIRSMFGQIWNSFALLRALNWLYKKVLSLLGFKVNADMGKEAWNQAINGTTSEITPNVSSWPIFMFLGMLVSAPYFISKLLPPVIDKRDPKNWPVNCRHLPVSYEFVASTPEELTIRPGETVRIAPKSVQDEMQLSQSGWLYAATDRGVGIVPVTYLQIATKKPPVLDVPTIVNSAIPGPSTDTFTTEEFVVKDTDVASNQNEPKPTTEN